MPTPYTGFQNGFSHSPWYTSSVGSHFIERRNPTKKPRIETWKGPEVQALWSVTL